MRKFLFSISIILAIMLVQSCSTPPPTSDQINLSWGVISNEYAETPQVKAKFIIENNSTYTFSEDNWALFYNQAPRDPIASDNNTRIEHISGDWFKLVPTEGFQLMPGKKVEIVYESSAWYIKASDAAVGPYFVFYDKSGNEQAIVEVDNYAVLPFNKPEQINRHRADAEPIPTAAWQFDNNAELFELEEDKLLPLVPNPVSYKRTGQQVRISNPVEILYAEGLENEANYLAELLQKIVGDSFVTRKANAPMANSIFLGFKELTVNGVENEAYEMQVLPNQSVSIYGSDAAGVFYGIQSLVALLPPGLFDGTSQEVTLPELSMKDAPRFPYRGMHLDVSRNFQSIETVKKVIDILAFYKLNQLLFYITEDEGWRIEIEELPELTEVGSHRGHTTKAANALHPAYGSGPTAYAKESNGSGFYSRQEFIELIQYAKKRHINIIPEIGFPGHSRAAIKAMEARYEKYMELGDEEKANEFRLIDPEEKSKYRSAQWYSDNIVNVARESTYRFYETVVDDVIEIYAEAGIELDFIHTGGDEVPEGSWSESPMCAELMTKFPEFKDPKNLQAYGTRRIIEMLQGKNLKIGGWEEVALLKDETGRYNPNQEFAHLQVYPYVWNTLGSNTELAYRLANAGYPVIMCNVTNFYFDLAYNKDPREPGLYWGGFGNTRDAWQVAPFDVFKSTTQNAMGEQVDTDKAYAGLERLKPEARKNIIGVQAQIWAETIKDGEDDLMYRILPKLMGFAETAWAAEREWETIENTSQRQESWNTEWNIFANTLAKKELPRLKSFLGGYNYRVPAPGGKIENGKLVANSTYPGLSIRYTTDGSEPGLTSAEYVEPVSVSGTVKIKAFDTSGKGSLSMEVN
ncbi:family 20 glycosylhydrolase [uncultured Draconibacterium sp.]|uniref:family 20 glycosylhydrolase n=1 Tax=uncultured Draconibacterium sp. TaxID=1573823 RepID=UPI0025F1AE1B|nr:family 20 glycosylhydrolase [uncultured Draconibacterium sp.]